MNGLEAIISEWYYIFGKYASFEDLISKMYYIFRNQLTAPQARSLNAFAEEGRKTSGGRSVCADRSGA